MMPLSSTDVQVLKLVNTPKLPASLFENAQPINVRVVAVNKDQATILLAGRQIQTQTTVPLMVGQQLSAQPELVNGKVQLKLIPNPEQPNTNSAKTTAQATAQTASLQTTQTTVNNNVQLLKILNAPQNLATLLNTGQTTPVRVLNANGNQATVLITGQTIQTKSTTTLTTGESISVLPEEVDGQLQLKIIPSPTQNSNQRQQQAGTATKDNQLPSWTNSLPNTAKEALGSLKHSLPIQAPLNELLRSLNQTLPTLLTDGTNKSSLSTAWQSFVSAALSINPAPTAEKIQQSVINFNPKLSEHKANNSVSNNTNTTTNTNDWKKDLTRLINDPQAPLAEKQIAQGILAKSEQTQQMQTLHQMAGQAVLLQEIPINTAQGLDNFTLEIDVPKPETPEEERQWKIFIQLELPQGDFTSRIQMDKDFNIRLQLWGNNEILSSELQQQAKHLRTALQEQGLTVESLIIAQGKPQSRTEQPPWHQPLVDIRG